MKTSAVTPTDLAASVFAVPPLPRRDDLAIDAAALALLVRHIEDGGIRTLLYGGNANLYHMGLREYPAFLDLIEAHAGSDTWVVPSAGPDFGKLMDQAPLLRARRFPAVMVLPMTFPAMPAGTARAVQTFADAIARPVILYLKTEQQMHLADIARLVRDGHVCGIKYAVPRPDPADDPFLERLLGEVDRCWVACGLAERSALAHLAHFGLASYTSGGICIAPRLAAAFLQAARRGELELASRLRAEFLPLEALRERTQVFAALHEAIALAGIAEMGTPLPMLAPLEAADREALRPIVRALLAAEAAIGERR